MEVLLLQDIAGIGKKNDLLQVGDGYALNCLLPQRVALVATPLVRRRYAELIRKRAEERETEKSVQAGNARALAGKTVSFERKATKTGKLYAAITEKSIAEALRAEHGIEVHEDAISVSQPIKSVGSFPVSVMLADQALQVTVEVKAEVEKA